MTGWLFFFSRGGIISIFRPRAGEAKSSFSFHATPRNLRSLIEPLEQRRLLSGDPGPGDPGDPGAGDPGDPGAGGDPTGANPIVSFEFSNGAVVNEEAESTINIRLGRQTSLLDEAVTVTFQVVQVGEKPLAGVGSDFTLSTTTVTIPAGEQSSDPFAITAIDDSLAEPDADGETEHPGEYFALKFTGVDNANFADTLKPEHATSGQIRVDDGTTWHFGQWENTKNPTPYANEYVGSVTEGDKEYYYWKVYEWRHISHFVDVSDEFGEMADLSGKFISWSESKTVGVGANFGINLGLQGVPVGVDFGVSVSEDWTVSQTAGVSIPAATGQSPATKNVRYQIAGYGLYASVYEIPTKPISDGITVVYDSRIIPLGYTNELSAAYLDELKQYWVDPDDPESQDKTTGFPPAPPAPQPKFAADLPTLNDTSENVNGSEGGSAWQYMEMEGSGDGA